MTDAPEINATDSLADVAAKARACMVCAAHLPLGPRPVFRVSETARVMIVGQAPGTKVHASGVPWDDPSGDRLRDWLDLDKDTFYDEGCIAIVPSGFCYPGRLERGGDAPPRPECAPLWHAPLISRMPKLELTLLVGQYAQAWYLGKTKKKTLTATVECWREFLPEYIVTPHPSWRSQNWLKKNPFFAEDVIPELRKRVKALL